MWCVCEWILCRREFWSRVGSRFCSKRCRNAYTQDTLSEEKRRQYRQTYDALRRARNAERTNT